MGILDSRRPCEIVGEIVDCLRAGHIGGSPASELVRLLEQENVSDLLVNEYFEHAFCIKIDLCISCFKKYDQNAGLVTYNDQAIDRYYGPLIEEASERWTLAPHYPDLMSRPHREIFRDFAKQQNCYLIISAPNPYSGVFVGKTGYRPAPSSLVAVSNTQEPNAGLMAADPHHEVFQNLLANTKPVLSYEQYVEKLEFEGWRVGDREEGYVIQDENGVMFYPTYCIEGVYQKDDATNAWKNQQGEKFRGELNAKFGEELVRLGALDVCEGMNEADPDRSASPRFPVICFEPGGNVEVVFDRQTLLTEKFGYWNIR